MKLYNLVKEWGRRLVIGEPKWRYKILKNCPQPPQKFIDLASTGDCSNFGSQPPSATSYDPGKNPRLNRKILRPGKTELEYSVRTPRYELGEEFNQWLRENVFTGFGETVVAISHQGNNGSFGPHTDRWRNYVLIYTIDPGGPNVRTAFWKEKYYPELRNRGSFINEYTNLTEVDSVIMKKGQWVILESRILHSVENIEGIRINFQISIDRDLSELEKFV